MILHAKCRYVVVADEDVCISRFLPSWVRGRYRSDDAVASPDLGSGGDPLRIRNAHMLLRTLQSAPGLESRVNTLAAEETGSADKDLKVKPTRLAAYNLSNLLFG